MMDKETYKRELIRMWDSIRDGHKGEYSCYGVDCEFCPLGRRCDRTIFSFEMIEAVEKWAKEHQPKKYKVSQVEYDFLKHISDNTEHIYITRDEYNCVYLFDEKPKKSSGHWYGLGACSVSVFNKLFQFVQWKDEEPTIIQDVLESCEVVDQ